MNDKYHTFCRLHDLAGNYFLSYEDLSDDVIWEFYHVTWTVTPDSKSYNKGVYNLGDAFYTTKDELRNFYG